MLPKPEKSKKIPIPEVLKKSKPKFGTNIFDLSHASE